MVELKRNKKTGIVEVWKNGVKVDKVVTIGDDIKKRKKSWPLIL